MKTGRREMRFNGPNSVFPEAGVNTEGVFIMHQGRTQYILQWLPSTPSLAKSSDGRLEVDLLFDEVGS